MNTLIVSTRSATPETLCFNDDLFNSWVRYIDAKPKTVETYTKAVRQFMTFLSSQGIKNPVMDDVKQFRDTIAVNHKPATVRAYLMAVKQFFKWTEQDGYYPDIAKKVKSPKIDDAHKKDYLTSGQVRQTLESIDKSTFKGKRDYALLSLMVTTGLRDIEVSRANIEDLRTVADFTALFVQGKGRDEKSDYVRLADQVECSLREYLKARAENDGSSLKGTDPLFASTANRNTGGRMTTRSISRIVKDSLISVGLDSDRLTAHSLRHTAATLNLLNGGTIEKTQQLLRHSNINTTMIYTHALERAKNDSEQRIADAIFN